MAKRKKKGSTAAKVAKFVGIAAAGGIIGGYSMRLWMKKVEPVLERRRARANDDDDELDDDDEPVNNPGRPGGTPMGYVSPFGSFGPPMPMTPLAIPQFVAPQWQPTMMPGIAQMPAAAPPGWPAQPSAAAPSEPARPQSKAEIAAAKMAAKRSARAREQDEVLERIWGELNEFYGVEAG